MTKPRKNAPALYELIGVRSRITPPGPHAQPEEYEEEAGVGGGEAPEEVYEEEAHRSILSPGRTVRMPVGYFFFGLAIVIATGIGGYLLGYQMRDAAYDREAKRRAQLDATPEEPLENWPINRDLVGPGPNGVKQGSGQGGGAGRPQSLPSPSAEIGEGPGWLVMVGQGVADPREKGLNYAIVATLGLDRAKDFARFLSERGVDVAVVRKNNASPLYFVIALKGFPSGTFRSEERQDYGDSLRALWQEWAPGGGEKDDDIPWWDKF